MFIALNFPIWSAISKTFPNSDALFPDKPPQSYAPSKLDSIFLDFCASEDGGTKRELRTLNIYPI
jgi:hypothetical protein